MSASNGRIMVEQAYAQGKMLDHSGLNLHHGISPMDFDSVIERNGYFLVVEFTRKEPSWDNLDTGQYRAFREAVKKPGFLLILARHSVPQSQAIETHKDVDEFTAWWDGGARELRCPGAWFPSLCRLWSDNPFDVFDRLNKRWEEKEGKARRDEAFVRLGSLQESR